MKIMNSFLAFALAGICTQVTWGQGEASPQFEVASVKRAWSVHGRGGGDSSTPVMLDLTGYSLKDIIETAYGSSRRLQPYQVVGGPDWIDDYAYDVTAKPGRKVSWGEMHLMLQNLLVERFHLAVRKEMRDLPGYWLLVGKNGPKIQRTADNDVSPGKFTSLARGEIIAEKESIDELAQKLSLQTHIPIANRTAITGRYNYSLEWSRFDLPFSPDPGLSTDVQLDRPSLFTAVQELGLRLERHTVPVEVIVVQHAEKPTEN